MNHQLLLFIDKLFAPIYSLMNLIKRGKMKSVNSQNFIVLKFFGIGSITRIVHVMETIQIEKSRVTFITLYKNRAVIDLLNLNVIYINSKNPFVFIYSLFLAIINVWNQKQTTVIDMERTSNLSGIFRLVIGLRKPCNSFYFKPNNSIKKGQLYVSLLNKPATNAIAEMFHKKYIYALTQNRSNIKSNKIFININAGNYCSERKFTPIKYAALIKLLHKINPEWQFYLTGSKEELKYVKSFERHLTNDIPSNVISNIAGKHNLSQFIECLKEAKLLITNDSGPLHLAHLFNIKTVGIWGPTSSKLIGYIDSDKMLNLESHIACSPCFKHPKSSIALDCKGSITCFESLNIEEMALKIIRFAKH